MEATFCLRLAAGLILMLPILSPEGIPPRFYRVQFLTALGLMVLVGLFLHEAATAAFWIVLALAVVCCLVGSIVWHLDKAPGGVATVYVSALALIACLVHGGILQRSMPIEAMRIADDVLSSLVIGSAITAMLMGHSYLIAPAMSIAPLMRLLGSLGLSIIVRIVLACFGLWGWSATQTLSNLETELMFLLPVRWLLGLIAPLVLGWMAWETARLRSTQSATGILYVVVILCFLGELMSLLLIEKTGFVL